MIESVVLGLLQGFAEWLPISSEGLLVLAQVNLFGETSIIHAVELSLFLHLGTFFAALIYFRKDVRRIILNLFSYSRIDNVSRREIRFYAVATLVSGVLGFSLLFIVSRALGEVSSFEFVGKIITGGIAALLFITAGLGFLRKVKGTRTKEFLSLGDGIILGIVQGCSALPGLSRSGTTVAAFLLRAFDDASALRLSFIMSLPIVLGGNIVLQVSSFSVSAELFMGLIAAFVSGFVTIHILLRIARRVQFSWFVLFFAVLTVASLFL
ncbi:MAG: hypothetical protein COU47_03380 [Candidatus Niyogibacteria bacterium CG10_big_fil_rev_8_21_14_0_10_46_36]|uniref:Undecaprenyl-diphosphatase n=1 Tax=Candidatus Niyogibacteria bacterium CG10_big_fil_rev_8_21_14_0_10_46_36 TaxID=1974726 RepID=A0A2H0TCV0_9BACT|nr:MAG: hypothetical protein COU47_03380 [Candidatus Niyogibacteria bacterium CG10_big_fil_rev_8_21_14_0_10_46_36]